MTQGSEKAAKSKVSQFPQARTRKNVQVSNVKKVGVEVRKLDERLEQILRESQAVWARGVL
jgi:hypothetical protein